jgi:hypothetical protein
MSESPEATAPAPGPESGAAEDCATCITARGVLIALGFAAFAAFVAADFATGGRLTALAVGALATLRGRVPPSSAGSDG